MAVLIVFTMNAHPAIPLVILMIIHLVDIILLIFFKPLGMVQTDLVSYVIFYPNYPKVYFICTVAIEGLFIVLEIFFIILATTRDSSSREFYQGIGFVVCLIVIALLLVGLLRLIWGILKLIQYCYLERETNYMSVEKEVIDN